MTATAVPLGSIADALWADAAKTAAEPQSSRTRKNGAFIRNSI